MTTRSQNLRFLFAIPLALLITTPAMSAEAPPADTMILNSNKIEITDFIQNYAKASGKRFMVDPGVHGLIGLHNPGPVSLDEAYNQLGAALAMNGFSFVQQGDLTKVMNSRNAQRSGIEVTNQLPELKPERMVTWVARLKHISAEEVNKRLRILPSKDGDMTPYEPTNSLMISDYTSNIHRIAKVIAEIDTPESAARTPKREPRPAPAAKEKSKT
jgi:general secretion pathway protein D